MFFSVSEQNLPGTSSLVELDCTDNPLTSLPYPLPKNLDIDCDNEEVLIERGYQIAKENHSKTLKLMTNIVINKVLSQYYNMTIYL